MWGGTEENILNIWEIVMYALAASGVSSWLQTVLPSKAKNIAAQILLDLGNLLAGNIGKATNKDDDR